MQKLQLLLARAAGADVGTLTGLLLDQFAFLRSQSGATYRLALRDAAARAVSPDMGVPEFDAVLELGVPAETGPGPLVARAAVLGPASPR